MLYPTTVTVHICTIIVANVQICTFLHPQMWVVLEENCVNFVTFCILEGLVWMLRMLFYTILHELIWMFLRVGWKKNVGFIVFAILDGQM